MPDDNPAGSRRPFGERDTNERNLPFGARRSASGSDSADPQHSGPAPDAPYNLPPLIQREPEIDVEEAVPDEFESPFKARGSDPDNPRAQTSIADAMGALGEEEPPHENGSAAEPALIGEPPDAPPNIRARERRGTRSDLLKARQAAIPDAPPAPRPRTVLNVRVIVQTLGTIFGAAALFATMFAWWTPNTFLPTESIDSLSVALATQTAPVVNFVPTLTPLPGMGGAAGSGQVVGIVSGHRGIHPASGLPDPGAVCEESGLTEQETVERVAVLVQEMLVGHGYRVDLLDEWDERLTGYSASAVISIHADSCEYVDDNATGFKVASFTGTSNPDADAKLVSCMISRYANTTEMSFHPSVTYDMTEYHNFRELQAGTPGAIIEIGFLYLDREMLTDHADVVALGIARGVLCYLRNEPLSGVESTRVP